MSSLSRAEPKCLIKKIDLKLQSECFEGGSVTWSISWSNAENKRIVLDSSAAIGDGQWELNEIANEELGWFRIRAELSGGSGQNAWQHTQLFRQSLKDNKSQFDVCFHF